MSKLFFDHLIVMEEVEVFVKKTAQTKEEREELWELIDEIIHHKVFDVILGQLPHEHHNEFLEKFHAHPHDESLIDYLKEKIGKNIEELIRQEIGGLSTELLESIKESKK
jgi:hypothetical protein